MVRDLVVRGCLTRPRDFGSASEKIVIRDWVDAKVLLPRLIMISIRINEYGSKSAEDEAKRNLKALIKELEGKEGKA